MAREKKPFVFSGAIGLGFPVVPTFIRPNRVISNVCEPDSLELRFFLRQTASDLPRKRNSFLSRLLVFRKKFVAAPAWTKPIVHAAILWPARRASRAQCRACSK